MSYRAQIKSFMPILSVACAFIALKPLGVIDWPWLKVLMPLLVSVGCFIAILIATELICRAIESEAE